MKVLMYYRVSSIFRCLYFKLVYRRQFHFNKVFYSGKHFIISVSNTSKIKFLGRTRFADFVEVGGSGILTIGDHFGVNSFSRVIAKNRIIIGENVIIARYVSILDHDHDIYAIMKGDFNKYTTAPIEIGNNVWIGDKVTVTKGVNIGDNVIIGANSVVSRDIPKNSIAVGSPCRVIKSIF